MTLRIGIIGAGNIFERGYLPALLETEAVRVVAVTDLDGDRAASAAARLARASTEPSTSSLVARDDIDAVLVLTPTDTHADLSITALEAGCHVLCEKPMARSAADATRMAAAATSAGRRLMIGHTRRFDERWTTMHDAVRAGRVGQPVYVFRSEHAFNGAPEGAWPWLEERSGGALWDVGIHVADLFHWFLDEVPSTAFTKVLRARPEAARGGSPDAALVTFDFGSARHAVLSVSWIHPPGWGPFYATTEVVGTGGKLVADDRDSHPTTVVTSTELEVPRYSPLLSATATAFRRELEHFAAAVETGARFAIEAEDALIAVRMIEAAERSARSGQPEPIA
jgi:myo-inositol 2-dehydrogenase / D-chiro-inositol 1-dehydrogenase